MQIPKINNRKEYFKVCGVISLLVIVLGIFLSWFNTGDLYTGLNQYGMAIIVMIIGVWATFHKSEKASTFGLMMVFAGILYLLMGKVI